MARDKPSRSRSRSLLATLLVAVSRLAIFRATVSRMECAAELVFLHTVHHVR